MRTRLLLRAAVVGGLLGGLVFAGWVYGSHGYGLTWLFFGGVLSATVAFLAGGTILVFHTPKDRSGS